MANPDYAAFEDAIAKVCLQASGLAAGKVYWEGQDVDRPALPYISLFHDAEECRSPLPEKKVSDNPNGSQGIPAQIAGTMRSQSGLGGGTVFIIGFAGSLSSMSANVIAYEGGSELTVQVVAGQTFAAFSRPQSGTPLTSPRQTITGTDFDGSPFTFDVLVVGTFGVGTNVYIQPTDPVVGTELLVDYSVPSEFHLRVQVYTSEVKGNSAAPSLLSRIHNWFDTEAARGVLNAAGLVCVERGTVQNLSRLIETKTEGRAALDVRMRFADGTQEALTYISSVSGSTEIDEDVVPFAVNTEPP